MNILFLCASFYPNIGGVEKHVFELSKKLIKKGHKISIITELKSYKLLLESTNNQISKTTDNNSIHTEQIDKTKSIIKSDYKNIEISYFDFGKNNWLKKFRIWYVLWKNREIIKESDLVHCHDVFLWYLPFRFLYPKKPVYTTFHGYESYPIKKSAIFIRKISEIMSWGNICVGDFIKKWYGTKPTIVTYGAVDDDLINIPQKKSIFYRNKESAVFVGRLDEQTNILEYTRAVDFIKKQMPGFEFLVVGDGKYKSKVEQKYKVTGFVSDPNSYYLKYHYSFVSRYLSILESMAAKRLVFALYDNPVKRDYLLMAPYAKNIIIADSSKELADKVIYYLSNPKKEKEKINNAFEWVEKQTWEKMVQIYLKIWKVKS